MPRSFTGRVVLITGAGSGIGRQLALELAERGAAIAALDLKAEPLESLDDELRSRDGVCALQVGDVTDRPSLHRAVAAFRERLGPIDILVANAGVGIETTGFDWRGADVERVMAVNLVGVANSIEAVLPAMLERRSGQLVAISSVASYRGVPLLTAYCASKAGVNALMEGLRIELRRNGIACTTICPGWIRTPLTAQVHLPMPGILEVDDACRRIANAIEKRRLYYAFPARTRWSLQLLQWLPARISDWLVVHVLKRGHKHRRK
jgi:NAD(P)-dependent dehydrogenase (short-subunit alcohol dehydrogenase family)